MRKTGIKNRKKLCKMYENLVQSLKKFRKYMKNFGHFRFFQFI